MNSDNLTSKALKNHIPALDGIRGLAAALVFIYHYGGGRKSSFLPFRIAGSIIHLGWIGVPLFFALSGFLITGILWDSFNKKGWWSRFYIRRSLRIFPLYYLALAIAAMVFFLSGVKPHVLAGLWVFILYLQNIPLLAPIRSQLPTTIWLGHFWSLAVEEQFYLVWPLILYCLARNRLRVMRLIIGLWFLSFAFRLGVIGLHFPPDWALSFSLGRSGELLTGSYLALLLRGNEMELNQTEKHLPLVFYSSLGSFLILVSYVIFKNFDQTKTDVVMSTLGLAILSIFFASLIATSLRDGVTQSVFAWGPLRWLGKLSYGIYVYHLLFRSFFDWMTYRLWPGFGYNGHLIALACVALIGTLLISNLSFYVFEGPFLHLKDRWHN